MKILMADDDADDRTLASIALKELNTEHEIDFVNDGQELLDYLHHKITTRSLLPDLILLDLNMPRKDGRVALKEIKTNTAFRHLDVVIFSTSASEDDRKNTLSNGAKNYFVKPSDYNKLLEVFKTICEDLVNS
jgi:CheY-like chemotaxis protein